MAQVIRSGRRSGSPTLVEEREDGSVVVEADAAEDGVAFARERFGADARIIEVNRLERGGVKGFFAREYFSVVAGPARAQRPPEPARVAPPVGARPEVDALVRQIGRVGGASTAAPRRAPAADGVRDEPANGIGHALGKVETEEEAFGSMLRRELHARGLTPSSPETIDLTDRSGRPTTGAGPTGSAPTARRESSTGSRGDGPVPVGPATARPLRPTSNPTPVPPPPVPPVERFRLDEPSAPTPTVARPVTPLPVRDESAPDAARATLQDAVVVESQAMVRPPRAASPPLAAGPAAEPEPEPAPVIGPEPAAVVGAEPEPVSAIEREPVAAMGAEVEPVVVRAEAEAEASITEVARSVEPTAPETPPGLGSVRWSVDRLAHLGLPFALVQRTVGLDPSDDQRWLLTLAAGLADFVRPEPTGSAVFAGPRADRIGAAMDLPVVEAPELPPYGGSVALKTTDDGAGRAWLSRVRGDRVLHVVVGGRGWELLLAKDPDAVVVSSADAVLSGLQVAVEHDVPISYVSDAEGLRRADALDLAIAVRSLVGRW